MIRLFKNIGLGLRSGIHWYRLLTKMDNKEFEQALEELGEVRRTKRNGIELDLTKALALHGLGRADECYDLCQQVLVCAPTVPKLSKDDIRYCQTYARWLMTATHGNTEVFKSSEPPTINSASLREICLEKVDMSLKGNFQLFIHPNWDSTKVRGLRHEN